jgi:excinuclease ABC subunit C
VRRGRLTGRESFVLEGAEVAQVEEQAAATGNGVKGVNLRGNLVGAFMQQYYDEATFIPKRVLVQAMPDTGDVLAAWLATLHGAKVEIRQPLRGPKRKLMQMAQENAGEYLRVQQAEWAADTNKQTEAITGLQEVLDLPRPPARMECFDISTLQGTNTVGAMVVFAKGAPLKSAYRRFKLHGKGSQGAPDDFASMRETLRRRFRRAVETNRPDPGKKARKGDEQWRILPDLLVIDGGKGQLSVAVEVLEEFGLTEVVPVVGLAKQEEELFLPGQSRSVWLKRGSPALHLVQRLRDEAHRWGITYHRNLRRKAQTRSLLDDVPGVGPSRRKALLTYYAGDLDKIRAADVDELAAIPGMTRKTAQAIKDVL